MKEKSEVSRIFPIFYKMIKIQFGIPIKRIRSDNARDYFNLTLSTFLQNEGIIHESSCVDTSQQNEVAKWKIDTYLMSLEPSYISLMLLKNFGERLF